MLDTQTFVLLWDLTTFIGLVVAIIATTIAFRDREHQRKVNKEHPQSKVKRFARMRLRAEIVKLYVQASYFMLGTIVIFTLENPHRPISFVFLVLYLGVLGMVIESVWYLTERRSIRKEEREAEIQAERQNRRETQQEERGEYQDRRQMHQDVREIHQDAREIEQEKNRGV